jgi:hypothetical protein
MTFWVTGAPPARCVAGRAKSATRLQLDMSRRAMSGRLPGVGDRKDSYRSDKDIAV